MMTRLVWGDVVRVTFRYRTLFALLVLVGGHLSSDWKDDFRPGYEAIAGLLAITSRNWLPLLVPLLVGIAVGGSFAEDQQTGYFRLVLARGISYRQYIVARALAMATSGGLITLASALLHLLLVIIRRPSIPFFEGSSFPSPGPVPALFDSHPWLNDALGLFMLTLAGAALALLGMLVSVLVRNEYLAAASPFAFIFLCAWVIDEPVLNPVVYLAVFTAYGRDIPLPLQSYAAISFWISFGAGCIYATRAIFVRREAA